MNEMDKLRVLIPHWIEHNQAHAQEFLDWAKKIDPSAEIEDVIADVQSAAEAMKFVNAHLRTALDKIGGPLEYTPEHTHSHTHTHDHGHTHHSHEHDHSHPHHDHEHD